MHCRRTVAMRCRICISSHPTLMFLRWPFPRLVLLHRVEPARITNAGIWRQNTLGHCAVCRRWIGSLMRKVGAWRRGDSGSGI